jgi:hypothetical protein
MDETVQLVDAVDGFDPSVPRGVPDGPLPHRGRLLGVVEVASADQVVVEVGIDVEQEDRAVAAVIGEAGDHGVAGAPRVAQPDQVTVGP